MSRRLPWFTALAALVFTLNAAPVWGQPPGGNNPEQAALRKRADAYVEAFNKGDAKTLASFWTADADIVDQSGREIKGRKAIEESYQALFAANKGAKLQIIPGSTRLVKPDLIIEDGTTVVMPADGGAPTSAGFTTVLVKQEGQWYLASLRERPAVPPSNGEHLQDLAWLVGDWTQEDTKGEVAWASFAWAENQNFIVSSTTLTVKDVPVAGQTQWIGWDTANKQVRSWAFQSSGGFGEGVWSKEGNKWMSKTTATLRDGKKMSATNVLTTVDADHFTFQSTQRSVDGQSLPDTPLMKMKRMKPVTPNQ